MHQLVAIYFLLYFTIHLQTLKVILNIEHNGPVFYLRFQLISSVAKVEIEPSISVKATVCCSQVIPNNYWLNLEIENKSLSQVQIPSIIAIARHWKVKSVDEMEERVYDDDSPSLSPAGTRKPSTRDKKSGSY